MNQPPWLIQVRGNESRYWYWPSVGSAGSLISLAEQLGQKWVREIVGAEALERIG